MKPERLVDRVLVLLGERLAGDHLVLPVWPCAASVVAMSLATCVCETPGFATTEICANSFDRVRDALRLVQREQR